MKVSVIIPIYNAAATLERCIYSALLQAETGEVICIDDGSTDHSLEICARLQQQNERIKILKNKSGKKGAGAARNVGIKSSKYDYVAFLDADDYYLEDRFKEDVMLFENQASLQATANTVLISTEDTKDQLIVNGQYRHGEKIGFPRKNEKVDVYAYFEGPSLHLNGLTLKKSVFQSLGYFDEDLKQGQDTDFIFRLLLIYPILTTDVKKEKAVYYIHSKNTIKNESEAIFYRRLLAQKHIKLALRNKLNGQLVIKFLKQFLEYDYQMHFGSLLTLKKWIKLLLLPYFLFRLVAYNFNK